MSNASVEPLTGPEIKSALAELHIYQEVAARRVRSSTGMISMVLNEKAKSLPLRRKLTRLIERERSKRAMRGNGAAA
jgi:hypothetical protein